MASGESARRIVTAIAALLIAMGMWVYVRWGAHP